MDSNCASSSTSSREHPLQRAVFYLALIALFIAPLLYGSYPQWISGFTVAAFCGLGILHVLVSHKMGSEPFPVPRPIAIVAGALLAWLCAMVLRDNILGTEKDRFPAVSIRVLPYAFVYLSAAMIGTCFGTRKRLKWLLYTATAIGLILGILTLFQWVGIPFAKMKSFVPNRPAGIFINPNRFAVMQSLCVSCGLGLFLSAFVEDDTILADPRIRLAQIAIWIVVLTTMAASLVVTLSRLTIFAFGLGLGISALIWVAYRQRRHDIPFRDLPLSERIQRVAFWSLPIVVMLGWFVMAFSVGSQSLSSRYTETNDSEGRWNVIQSVPPLFAPTETKFFGSGLGSFEAVYTSIQPATLAGRWNRLHSDWIQLALEGGIPALLLSLALVIIWVVFWRRKILYTSDESSESSNPTESRLSGSYADSNTVLRLAPFSGIFTVVIASGADFPLRETGVGLLFFFLAGAVIYSRPDSKSGITDTTRSVPRLAVSLVLIAALLWSAWIAGRNTFAFFNSPWRGQLFLPVDAGTNPAAWERAIALDPNEEQFHYLFAVAADNQINAPNDVLEKGLDHARAAATLSPREYHNPWVAASLSEKLQRYEDAETFHARAISLFPENVALKLDAGTFYLRRFVKGRHHGSMQRLDALEKALALFRFVVKHDPDKADTIADWLDDSGCTSDEIMSLWVGNDVGACLGRARYFGDRELWDFAARALVPIDPATLVAGKHDYIWYYTLLGAVEFFRKNDERGIERWSDVLDQGVVRNEYMAYMWISNRIRRLSAESAERIADTCGERLKVTPYWVNSLAHKLHESGKDFAACALLGKTAGTIDYLCAIWADSALAIGDTSTAELQALQVWRFSSDGSNWLEWRKDFDVRLEQQKLRDKAKKK